MTSPQKSNASDTPRFFVPPSFDDIGDLDSSTLTRLPSRRGPDRGERGPELGTTPHRQNQLLLSRHAAEDVRRLIQTESFQVALRKELKVSLDLAPEFKHLHTPWTQGSDEDWGSRFDDFGGTIVKALDPLMADSEDAKALIDLMPLRLTITAEDYTAASQPVDAWGVLKFVRDRYIEAATKSTDRKDLFETKSQKENKARVLAEAAANAQARVEAVNAAAARARSAASDLKATDEAWRTSAKAAAVDAEHAAKQDLAVAADKQAKDAKEPATRAAWHAAIARVAASAAATISRIAGTIAAESSEATRALSALNKLAEAHEASATGLQALANKAEEDARSAIAEARQAARDYWVVAEPVSLNHVLVGPDTTGTPHSSPRRAGGAPHSSPRSLDGVPHSSPRDAGGTPHSSPRGSFDSYRGMDAGRTPVAWIGGKPQRREGVERPPVVMVIDSGVGEHTWLEEGTDVERDPRIFDGGPLFGQAPITAQDDLSGAPAENPLGLLGDASGHGTFIAGLIRQKCPDAKLLSVRVLGNDNIADEATLVTVLTELACRQLIAKVSGNQDYLVDIVTLSLGYYDEHSHNEFFTSALQQIVEKLGELGVLAIAAAGNDATRTPLYPAGFAPRQTAEGRAPRYSDTAALPLVSVGALNPDLPIAQPAGPGTVAAFSNEGPWVTCYRPGANLVSTMPTTYNGSMQPYLAIRPSGRPARAGIDPDNYVGGFAVWSGTSFAVGVLAGEVAAKLVEVDQGSSEAEASTRVADASAKPAPGSAAEHKKRVEQTLSALDGLNVVSKAGPPKSQT